MKYRKTNRTKRFDSGCANHGSCKVCLGNRLHNSNVHLQEDVGVLVAEATEPPESEDRCSRWTCDCYRCGEFFVPPATPACTTKLWIHNIHLAVNPNLESASVRVQQDSMDAVGRRMTAALVSAKGTER